MTLIGLEYFLTIPIPFASIDRIRRYPFNQSHVFEHKIFLIFSFNSINVYLVRKSVFEVVPHSEYHCQYYWRSDRIPTSVPLIPFRISIFALYLTLRQHFAHIAIESLYYCQSETSFLFAFRRNSLSKTYRRSVSQMK